MHTQILAILEVKKVISHKEAEALATNFRDSPQSTDYPTTLEEVKKLIDSIAEK